MALSLSVFDRLLDDSPDLGQDMEPSRSSLYVQVRDALKRDLEVVLNSRRRFLSPPAYLQYLADSLMTYGMSDFSLENVKSMEFKNEFRLHILDIIKRLEPRLSSVDVRMLDGKDEFDRTLRFRITGSLVLGEGEREEIVFNSYLDALERNVVIEK
jgi:type VI secretion system protein ImpF